MPEGHVLEFTRVTKRFNDVTAVSDFSARVEPGVVTAFLGPNGAGKTTTLRILLGQVRPSSGTATIGGVAFADLRTPLKTIGSVLEETVYRPRRSAARQLTIAAKANGIPLARVDEVLALVGLDGEREGRIGSFSLGMRQRLSVAHALLGDAGTLVFDEPANGLDPEGIRWMRLLMRRLADEGRTVLVSSHVLSEVEQVADHVLVLSKGRLVLSSGIESLADPASGSVVVDAADRAALTAALAEAGFEVEVLRSGLTVRGGDAKTVGALAATAGIALSTLVQRGPTLEDVFIDLVRGGKFEPRPAIAAAADDVVVDDTTDAEESDIDAAGTSADAVDAGAVAAADAAGAEADVIAVDGTADADAEVTVTDAEADAAAVATVTDADAGWDETEPRAEADADADAPGDSEETNAESGEDRADGSAAQTESADVPVDADAATAEESASPESGPSFDEILFGSGPAASAESSAVDASGEPGDDHVGTEIFAGLGEESSEEVPTHDSAADRADSAEAHGDDASEEAGEAEEADPRSAAVSSMLAAAARAYYDDEPQPYPFGEGSDEASASDEHGDSAPDSNGHSEQAEHDGSEHVETAHVDAAHVDTDTAAGGEEHVDAEDESPHSEDHGHGEHQEHGEHHEHGEHNQGEHDHHEGERHHY
ncbi:ABC-2 type transport system ATP-binding protein [Microbacterium natoriense]|uniref:ABC-2 type transport system ATP-binding protein n=1 Tax=Microbacterium natoriense TaxID=284570 RepID=A0AAW8ESJ8_9MICO|nr:ATP-binding cassette domain-containing protein [Microbacterium natoriense]MDQ0645819.1 ABC-2 type transport system ATP-binding protein [Microbacterium natoriense]